MTPVRKAALLGAISLIAIAAHAWANPDRPYAGLEARAVKAISDRDADDLLAGRGMGMALPAELNGYPGPRHVLDLADRLKLAPEQRQRTQALIDEMQTSAIALGKNVLAAEAALDHLFASAKADEAQVRAAADEVAHLRGALRFLYLKYHLAMRDLLTDAQRAAYADARGYGAATPHSPLSHHPKQ